MCGVVYTPPKYPLTASDYLAVDAWMMWDPLLSDAEHTGELRVVASGEGRVNNHQFYLSRRDYLAQHGDIMRRLLTELTHTGQFIDSHRGEAARLLSAELGIDARSLSMALARRSHRPRPMDLSVIRAQQTIADRFYAPRAYRQTGPGARSGVVRRTRAGRHQTADGGQLAKFARYLP